MNHKYSVINEHKKMHNDVRKMHETLTKKFGPPIENNTSFLNEKCDTFEEQTISELFHNDD